MEVPHAWLCGEKVSLALLRDKVWRAQGWREPTMLLKETPRPRVSAQVAGPASGETKPSRLLIKPLSL